MWDVVVVGARCAGTATALRFARSGRSVLLLDKARLASDTLSTHVLVEPAIAQLRELGLLDAVCATGAPPVHTFLVEFDGKAFPSPIQGESDFLLSVRRTVLDPLLVRAAEHAGVTVRSQVHVETLLWENDRVVGVGGRDKTGRGFTEQARLVIGADGRHSLVAQQVHAPEYNVLECENGVFYAYFAGIGPSVAGADVLQFASGPECDELCCPCDGDLHVVLLNVSRDEFLQINAQGPGAYEARLRTIPSLAPRLQHAKRVSKLHPASPREMRGYFRIPYGPGWVLVGDAGYYAHPAAASGIADTLRAAALVHGFVEQAWAENQPAEMELAEYQRVRDAENTETFYFSYRLSKVNPFTDPEVAAAMTGGQANEHKHDASG
jgi:2-polyprenyl-6-methoxyphenol hydroxylase-like FAD-dependent oxidoreductase